MLLIPLSRAAVAAMGTALLLLTAELWTDATLLLQAARGIAPTRQDDRAANSSSSSSYVSSLRKRIVDGTPTMMNRTIATAEERSNVSLSLGLATTSNTSRGHRNRAVDDAAEEDATASTTEQPEHKSSPSTTASSLSSSPLLPMRTCRSSSFPIPNKKRWSFSLEYQCNGTEYEEFAALLHQFANNVSLHTNTWGRRPHPFPANTSVLFMGNSHTKQTALELVCQYSDQIKEVKQRHRSTVAVTFTNGAQLYLVQNSPIEMAVSWTTELEKLVFRPLDSFQAVVLGQFNGAGSDVRNTSYYQVMKNWSDHDSDGQLQFGTIEPPSFQQVAQAFAGPIVFVSNYDRRKVESARQVLQAMDEMRHQTNRTNFAGVMSRSYIDVLNHNECGTDWRFKVGDCGPTRTGSHRCVGAHGGHPTLVAHDVQEALYSLLPEATTHDTAQAV